MKQSKTGPAILVVEDEISLQKVIQRKLELCGYQVFTARSTKQALVHIESITKISAIWLDHYLIGKNCGLDLVDIIKKEYEQLKDTPIFVISNTVSPEKINAYTQLGIYKYYVKSNVSLNEITSDIAKFINSSK